MKGRPIFAGKRESTTAGGTLDGLTMTAMLREQFPTVPVVILTVYRDEVFEQEAMSAGAAAYLVKQDIDGDEIPGLLREVIEKVRRRSRGEDLQV
jgi:DNA-binding NarL/FixJ family response regulator